MVQIGAWENAPWMIGGGVEHSVEMARLLAYGAHGGKEGIIRSSHLAVKPLEVAGAGVRVTPGACVILNRTGETADNPSTEAYVGRCLDDDVIAIPGTTGAAATYMIVARVEDPFVPGNTWNTPAVGDRQTTQYIFGRALPVTGTPKSLADAGLNYSAIPLARVHLPPNTSTILSEHITDLRKLYLPQSLPAVNELVTPSARDELTSATFVNWPSSLSASTDVPSWATHARVRVLLGQVGWGASGGPWSAEGNLRVQIGSTDSTSIKWSVDSDSGIDRGTIVAGAAKMPIPTALRGTTQTVRMRGQRTAGTGTTGNLIFVDAKSLLSMEVTWIEEPETA